VLFSYECLEEEEGSGVVEDTADDQLEAEHLFDLLFFTDERLEEEEGSVVLGEHS
jgi:hypothetical protein